jgi:two-component system response regulator HydG
VKPHALVVDDDDGVRYTLAGILSDHDIDVTEAKSGEHALAVLEAADERAIHLVITDLRMPGMSGLDLLASIRRRPSAPRVILITAHGSERVAVEAIKRGAYDYFHKPFEMDELMAVVDRALDAVRLEAENERLASALTLSQTMVFTSEAMHRLAVLVHRVAPRDVTVLIHGESGTGKERVAEAIVRASRRAKKPFVRFNCAALTPQLAEAELFGHSKGAFTGAHRERTGLFREADGGTILLDEVAELDLATQAKLLRVLQEREVRPVGEDRAIPIDVRVIAATHRDLARCVEEGTFREDLYYRLRVVELEVPPLRDRCDDIPPLARHFLAQYAQRFDTGPVHEPPELIGRLVAMPWPGNVRELENAMESLVALSEDGQLDMSTLPGTAAPLSVAPTVEVAAADSDASLKERVDAFERLLLVEALETAGGNRSEAARVLGIGRATLHDKLRKHGLGST